MNGERGGSKEEVADRPQWMDRGYVGSSWMLTVRTSVTWAAIEVAMVDNQGGKREKKE
jgi:hypothetical protein